MAEKAEKLNPRESVMNDFNIRAQVQNHGFSNISGLEKEIAKDIESGNELNQLDMIRLQQKTSSYTNMISLMSTMLKTMADTDKEIIRNC